MYVWAIARDAMCFKKLEASLGCSCVLGELHRAETAKMTWAVKAGAHPQIRPLTVTGLRWVPRQQLTLAGVALETGSPRRAGLCAAVPCVAGRVSIPARATQSARHGDAAAQNFLFR